MGYKSYILVPVYVVVQNHINSSTNAHKENTGGVNGNLPNLVLLVASHQSKHDAGALMQRALLHSSAQMYVVKSLVLQPKYPKE